MRLFLSLSLSLSISLSFIIVISQSRAHHSRSILFFPLFSRSASPFGYIPAAVAIASTQICEIVIITACGGDASWHARAARSRQAGVKVERDLFNVVIV